MAITITKQGTLSELQQYDAVCYYCKCEFSFLRKDSEIEFTPRNETYLKVVCPTCSKEVWVPGELNG